MAYRMEIGHEYDAIGRSIVPLYGINMVYCISPSTKPYMAIIFTV